MCAPCEQTTRRNLSAVRITQHISASSLKTYNFITFLLQNLPFREKLQTTGSVKILIQKLPPWFFDPGKYVLKKHHKYKLPSSLSLHPSTFSPTVFLCLPHTPWWQTVSLAIWREAQIEMKSFLYCPGTRMRRQAHTLFPYNPQQELVCTSMLVSMQAAHPAFHAINGTEAWPRSNFGN
jgi:hypothetical protein